MIQEGIPEATTRSPEAQVLAASIGVILVVVGLCGAALADLVSMAGRLPSASATPIEIAPMSYVAPAASEICAAPARLETHEHERHPQLARRSGVRHAVVRHRARVEALPDAVASLEDSMHGVEFELGSAALRGASQRIH